jgi:hypothetical protein
MRDGVARIDRFFSGSATGLGGLGWESEKDFFGVVIWATVRRNRKGGYRGPAAQVNINRF